MNLGFLPNKVLLSLKTIDLNYLYEIRMRTGYPIKVNFNGDKKYLGEKGITKIKKNALVCTDQDICYVIDSVTEQSLYAFNDRIKSGYITTENGIRIGICGECVFDDNKIITVKNFSSLNIRIPHEIIDCCNDVYQKITDGNTVFNTLIVSPPFDGKTTMLKDLVRKLNEKTDNSILIIDERGEFSSLNGENIDKIIYSDKFYAFNYAIRSMAPEIIITDEIVGDSDWQCAKNASESGVKIVASCHADNIENVKNKSFFIDGVFERYVILHKQGQVKRIYDKNFVEI